jgi:prepilin-type processing-associated H-X9-DG protein
MYVGYDLDVFRWTKPNSAPLRDGTGEFPDHFGSAHPAGCNFVFADGSMHFIRYDIDPTVHRWLGNRQDGNAIRLDTTQ